MKKIRFVLTMVLVLALLAAAPLSALAATWEAETSADVANAFITDTDVQVTINMKNDITLEQILYGNAGQNYTINGNGNTIADVKIGGEGAVQINADVTNDENPYAALEVYDSAQVTVNGDVSTQDAENGNAASSVVYASGEAQVTVNGDVIGGDGCLTEEQMQDPSNYGDGSDGVEAAGNAQITVNGDVTGGDSMGNFGYGGDGVAAYDQAQVTVTGDVTGGNVTGNPNAEAYSSRGGHGVGMEPAASVTVEGDVTAGNTDAPGGTGGNGIYVDTYYSPDTPGSVKVGGTVTAGAGSADGKDGAAVQLGSGDEVDWCLEDALAAKPADIVEEYSSGVALEDTKLLGALMAALELMQENGDLTEEELDAYREELEKLTEGLEGEEEMLHAEVVLMQKCVKNEASSDNLLELTGGLPEMDIYKVSDSVGQPYGSVFGTKTAQLYMEGNSNSGSNGNPNTGEAPTAMILCAVMVICALGMTALVVTRKKTA